jgi:hypothetical protein
MTRRYVLVDWLQGVLKVVISDLAAEEGAGLDREAVVQSRPDAGVVGSCPQVVCRCEVPRHRQVWRALDVDVEPIGPEEVRRLGMCCRSIRSTVKGLPSSKPGTGPGSRDDLT